jgi:hypothetical protein
MCDSCGVIFSENEEGWSTANRTVNKRNAAGRPAPLQQAVDLCARCTGSSEAPAPRLAVTAQAEPVPPLSAAEQAEAAEREDDHVMLRSLQRQVDELAGAPARVSSTVVYDGAEPGF